MEAAVGLPLRQQPHEGGKVAYRVERARAVDEASGAVLLRLDGECAELLLEPRCQTALTRLPAEAPPHAACCDRPGRRRDAGHDPASSARG